MSLRNRSKRYRSLCAPTHKTGSITEDLRSIFQCNDDQDRETLEARFSRGSKCLQRRIEEMALHSTNTHENRNARKRHLIPVKLTYAFAKDCLRRYAPDSEVREFERDINKRMSDLYGRRYSIENNIRSLAPTSRTLRRATEILGPEETRFDTARMNTVRMDTAAPRRIYNSRTYRRRKNTPNSNNLNNIRTHGYDNIVVTLTRR